MAPRKTRGGGTPESVAQAAAEATKLHEQVYGRAEPDIGEEATQEQAAPVEEKAAEGGDIQPVEAPTPTDSTENTDPPASPPTPEPQAKPEVDWEEKYRVLQGKYNAEVPRLNNELRELKLSVRELQSAPPPAAPAEPEPSAPQETVVSEQDLVDYGDDLVDLIRRVARAEAAEKTKDLTPTIEEIKGQVEQSKSERVTNSVYSKLDSDVQDWKEINKSPEFIGWLQEIDPYVGDVRQNLLSDAFAKGDGNRVVAFFRGYLAEQQALTPTTVPAEKPQVRLEDLAGPASGTNGGTPASQPAAPPSWTRANIAAFYSDVQKGKYSNNPARKAQIEASIAQAMSAGAIQ